METYFYMFAKCRGFALLQERLLLHHVSQIFSWSIQWQSLHCQLFLHLKTFILTRISQGKTPNVRRQKFVSNSLQYLDHNIDEMLPVPSMISVVGSTSYEQGSTDAGTDSSSARAGRDTWLELSPEPRGCPFSKAPSSFGMESSPSVHSWRKEEWQKKRHK